MDGSTRDFPLLCGNDATKARLAHAIRTGSLSHAILIAGPRGSGRHTLARGVAAAANCARRTEGHSPIPCGVCDACRRILQKNHPDVKVLGKSEGKATIGVAEMRLFREDMFLSATESDKKIYLIEDADDMTPQAQNALLKVLEEPPSDVHILLLAETTAGILPTVRSRTQLVRTQRLSEKRIAAWITGTHADAARLQKTEPERFSSLLRFADGRIGQAIGLLDAHALEKRENERKSIFDLLAALSGQATFDALYTAVMALPTKRDELCDALEILLLALRDMILSSSEDDVRPLFFASAKDAREAARGLSDMRLFSLCDTVLGALEDAKKNVMISTLLSDMAAKIKRP